MLYTTKLKKKIQNTCRFFCFTFSGYPDGSQRGGGDPPLEPAPRRLVGTQGDGASGAVHPGKDRRGNVGRKGEGTQARPWHQRL